MHPETPQPADNNWRGKESWTENIFLDLGNVRNQQQGSHISTPPCGGGCVGPADNTTIPRSVMDPSIRPHAPSPYDPKNLTTSCTSPSIVAAIDPARPHTPSPYDPKRIATNYTPAPTTVTAPTSSRWPVTWPMALYTGPAQRSRSYVEMNSKMAGGNRSEEVVAGGGTVVATTAPGLVNAVPLAATRLRHHVERFVEGIGGSRAKAQYLVQVLQLELRDIVRRNVQAEAEVGCLREHLKMVSNAQLERETADRRSLAGMALAHADASAELRARLSSAVQALEASEAEKTALRSKMEEKERYVAEQDTEIAKLKTAAGVAQDGDVAAVAKTLARKQDEEIAEIKRMWERRLATAEEAHAAARRRWETGGAPPSGGAYRPAAACVKQTKRTKSALKSVPRTTTSVTRRRARGLRRRGTAAVANRKPRTAHAIAAKTRPRNAMSKAKRTSRRVIDGAVVGRGQSNDDNAQASENASITEQHRGKLASRLEHRRSDDVMIARQGNLDTHLLSPRSRSHVDSFTMNVQGEKSCPSPHFLHSSHSSHSSQSSMSCKSWSSCSGRETALPSPPHPSDERRSRRDQAQGVLDSPARLLDPPLLSTAPLGYTERSAHDALGSRSRSSSWTASSCCSEGERGGTGALSTPRRRRRVRPSGCSAPPGHHDQRLQRHSTSCSGENPTTCADRYTSDIEGRSRRDQFTSKNCGLGFHHNRDHVRGGNKSYCIGNNSSQPENIKIDEAVRKRLGMEENDNGHGGRRTRNHHTENSYISGQSSRQPRHTGQSCITSADVATAAAVAADTFECGEESQLSCNSLSTVSWVSDRQEQYRQEQRQTSTGRRPCMPARQTLEQQSRSSYTLSSSGHSARSSGSKRSRPEIQRTSNSRSSSALWSNSARTFDGCIEANPAHPPVGNSPALPARDVHAFPCKTREKPATGMRSPLAPEQLDSGYDSRSASLSRSLSGSCSGSGSRSGSQQCARSDSRPYTGVGSVSRSISRSDSRSDSGSVSQSTNSSEPGVGCGRRGDGSGSPTRLASVRPLGSGVEPNVGSNFVSGSSPRHSSPSISSSRSSPRSRSSSDASQTGYQQRNVQEYSRGRDRHARHRPRLRKTSEPGSCDSMSYSKSPAASRTSRPDDARIRSSSSPQRRSDPDEGRDPVRSTYRGYGRQDLHGDAAGMRQRSNSQPSCGSFSWCLSQSGSTGSRGKSDYPQARSDSSRFSGARNHVRRSTYADRGQSENCKGNYNNSAYYRQANLTGSGHDKRGAHAKSYSTRSSWSTPGSGARLTGSSPSGSSRAVLGSR